MDTFGALMTALAVFGFLSVALEMGLESYASKAVATQHFERAMTANWLHVSLGISIMLVGVFVMLTLSRIGQISPSLALVPVYILLERRLSFRIGNMIAHGLASKTVIPVITGRLVSLLLLVGLIYFTGTPPIFAFVLSVAVGAGLAALVISRRTAIGYRKPSIRQGWATLGHSRDYWFAGLTGQLRTLDTAVINIVASAATAGLYGLPARAVSPLRLIGTSIASVAFPLGSRHEHGSLRRLNKWTAVLTLLSLGATFALWPFIPTGAALALGDRYRDSGVVLRILLIGISLNMLGSVLSGQLQGLGDSRFVARAGGVLAALFFLLVITGAHVAGAPGAAWGVTLTFGLQLLIFVLRTIQKDFS